MPILTFRVIALSLMLAWPVQPAAQVTLRAPDDVLADAGTRGAVSTLEPEGATKDLSDYLGAARPIVIFADGPDDPRLKEQLQMLRRRTTDLEQRDIVVLIDTDPAAQGMLRLQLRPHGFSIVLINKDGGVALRRSDPISARTLVRLIDRMPARREEIESSRSGT